MNKSDPKGEGAVRGDGEGSRRGERGGADNHGTGECQEDSGRQMP